MEMSRALLQSRARAMLAALGCLMLVPGCADTSRYMGISLVPGQTDAALQQLAARSRMGDGDAQLDLGIRFEEGRGVPADLAKALKLYSYAATGADGRHIVASGSGQSSIPPDHARDRVETAIARYRSLSRRRNAGADLKRIEDAETDRFIGTRVSLGSKTVEYLGKFRRSLRIIDIQSEEHFNSPIFSRDSSSPEGICRIIEAFIRTQIPGDMTSCQAVEWIASAQISRQHQNIPVRYFSIQYGYSSIPEDCNTFDLCKYPPFYGHQPDSRDLEKMNFHRFLDDTGIEYRFIV